jgi:hypothetical protein
LLLGAILLALAVARRIVDVLWLLARDPRHYEIGGHEAIVGAGARSVFKVASDDTIRQAVGVN